MSTRISIPFLALFLASASSFAGAAQSPNPFRTQLEPVRAPTPRALVTCGEVVTGKVTELRPEAGFLFRGDAGDVVDLALVEAAGPLGAAFLRATLVSPSGTELGVFNGTGLTTWQLTEAGPHLVRVTAGILGRFHIGVACRPPKSVATELVAGVPVAGEIAGPGRIAYYAFPGEVGQTLRIGLVETEGFAESAPRGTLLSPSGAVLGEFDADSLTSFEVFEAGTHLVRVRANTLVGTGTYSIGLSAPPPTGTPIPIVPCSPPTLESIANAGSVDYFSFDGAMDDVVEIGLVATNGFGDSVPQYQFTAPSGTDLGTYSADSLTPFQLPETGTYFVEVRANTLVGTGSYALGVSCRPPLGSGTPLSDGGSISSTLVDPVEVDYYTFLGQTGETADITFTEDSGFPASTPQMRVFAPSGVDLGAFNADNAVTIPIALEETGTYSIRVTANTLAETGGYTLALNILPAPFAAVHLGATSLSQSSILAAGEVDLFTFDGTTGEVIELTLTQSGFPSGVSAHAMLFDPLGMLIATFNANTLNAFTLADTGRHSVEVRASNGLGTGNYNFNLERRKPLEPLPPPLVCGQLYSDSIDFSAELDYFSFEGDAGDQVQLTLVQSGFPSGAYARATLFAPSGANLGTQNANGIAAYTLPEPGRYSVRVFANNLLSTGNYSLGLECVVPLGPVEAHLVCGDLVSDSIAVAGEVDYFTLDGSQGDQVQLTLVQSGYPSGAYARATLYSPGGVALGNQNANGITAYTLPESGTYAVRIWTNNFLSTGSYSLGLECVVPLGPVEAHLECGSLVSDSIGAAGDVDYFTFDGSLDDQVQLTLVQSGYPSGAYARATLFSPSGVALGNQNANGITAYTLPESGTYAVRIWTNNFLSVGSYSLGLECVVPLGPVEAHLVCGDLVSDSIAATGEVDYFTFDGSLDDQVQLTLVQSGYPSGAYARATLFSPGGVALGTQNANGFQPYTLPESGTYAVRVWTNNYVSLGSYSLGLECVVPLRPVEAHLVCGDLVSSSIGAAGEIDFFTFDGSTDDQVQLTLVQSGYPSGAYARASLFSPGGTVLGTQNANGIMAYTLPEPGMYAVRVWTNNFVSTGSYSLGLECVLPLGPVEAHLECGALVSDSIGAAGEVDYFTFDGSTDDQVQLTLVQSGYPSGAYARATLFSPSGVVQGTQNANGIVAYTLPEPGTYAVRIWTNNFVSTGSYSLGLECVVPLGPVEAHLGCGDLVSGSIGTAGEVDYFTFDGSIGEQIDLTLVQSGFPSGAYARATLYAPSGAVQGTQNANGTMAYTLPEPGTYAVRVWTNNFVSTGSYDLGLECP